MISNWLRSSIKCFDQSLKSINGLFMFWNKQEKQIWVFQLWQRLISSFEHSHQALGFLKEEWNRIAFVLISDCSVNKCNSFWIFCIFWCCCQGVLCALEVVKIIILGVCCAKVSVFLEGFKVTLLWWFVCNLFWLLSGLSSGFWGLDVALGLRVNQYKLFVYLFLPLNSFKFSCYCFIGINNWLFRRNNRLFRRNNRLFRRNNRLFHKNNRLIFWCFVVLCLNSWLTEILIWFHTKDFVLLGKVFKNPS